MQKRTAFFEFMKEGSQFNAENSYWMCSARKMKWFDPV